MRAKSVLALLAAAIVFSLGLVVSVAGNVENKGVARGADQLYAKYCVSCHGRNGRAKTTKAKFNHARDIADVKWQDDVSDERIYNSIMNGRNVRGNMPGFSKKISEQEADALVAYVRGLRK